MDYYRDQVTLESWELLTKLSKAFRFILIGGWAVWLYTKQLKSKDIDIILSFEELPLLRGDFDVVKNDRLHKYEARKGLVQIDVYVPHYSKLGLSLEIVQKHTVSLSGFQVPTRTVISSQTEVPELALNRHAYARMKKKWLAMLAL